MRATSLSCYASSYVTLEFSNTASQTMTTFIDPQKTLTFTSTENVPFYGDCGDVVYSLSMSPSSATTNLISLSTTSPKTVIFAASTNCNDAKTYLVTVRACYPSVCWGIYYATTSTISVTYLPHPCCTTTLLQPDPALQAMTTSVLASAITQQVGVFNDQYSVNQGSATTQCGLRTYSISSVISSGATSTLSGILWINSSTGLIQLDMINYNDRIGTHTATVVAKLVSFPLVSVQSTFIITINACVITSLKISRCSSNSVCDLSAQTYNLGASYSHSLYTYQIPNCGYAASGWILSATGGPVPDNFDNISSGNVHTVATNTDKSQLGAYTIQIEKVILNGISYGPQGDLPLQSPSSYTLTVQTGCASSSITAKSVASITIKVYDPIAYYPSSGEAFAEFTDAVSSNRGDPTLCPKTYSVLYYWRYPFDIGTLTTINVDSTTRKFQIYSGALNQVGTHYYRVRGAMTAAPSNARDWEYLEVNVINPCPSTTLIQPSALSDMSTSVLIGNSVYQQVGTIKDQVSVTNGDGTGTQYCGTRYYSISSVVGTATTPLSNNLIISSTGQISLYTSSQSKVGTHLVTVTCGLSSYTAVTPVVLQFTVTINPCVITSLKISRSSVNGVSDLIAQTYNLGTSYSLPLYTYQVPNCGYAASDWILSAAGPVPDNFDNISSGNIHTITPTTDKTQVGVYTIKIEKVTLNGISYGPQGTIPLPSPFSYTLTVQTGCTSSTVTAKSVASITIKVWDPIAYYPSSGEAFAEFTDTVSSNRGDPTLCPKTYSVVYYSRTSSDTLTTINVDSTTRKFYIYSGAMNQIGTHYYTVKGALTEVPSISATSYYLQVNVIDPCPGTTLIQPSALIDMSTSPLVGNFVYQQVGVIKDQLSVTNGDGTGTQYCGTRYYSISSVVGTATTALNAGGETSLAITSNGQISLKTSLQSKVGTHLVTVTCSLSSYTAVAPVVLQFTVTINPCVITSLKISRNSGNSFSDLNARTYNLGTSYTLPLYTYQVPNCGYAASDWILSAAGPVPDNFDNISSGNIHTITPTTDKTQVGAYTIKIEKVTLNGISYGPQGSIPLPSPFSYTLTVQTGCSSSSVTAKSVASITIKVWDPIAYYPTSGEAFEEFTDTVSQNSGDPTLCPKSYTFWLYQKSSSGTLTTIMLDSTTRKFQIYSGDMNQIGTHRYYLRGALTEATNRYSETTFDVIVKNPCTDTTLIQPSALIDMSTSPLVGNFVVQQVGAIKDQVSVTYGDGTGTQHCGARQYSISSVVGTATTALNAGGETSLTITSTGEIRLITSLISKMGTHLVTVTCRLSSYPAVTPVVLQFTVTINPCVITSLLVQQPYSWHRSSCWCYVNDLPSSYQYTLSSTGTFSLSLYTKQTLNCGYSNSNWVVTATGGPSPSDFQSISAAGVYTVGPITDTSKAGAYTIQITSVTVGPFTFGTSPALATPSSFILNVINPCKQTVNVYATSVSDFQIFTTDPEDLYPATGAAFLEFTDQVSINNNVPNMCAKTYSVVCGSCSSGCATAGSQLTTCSVDNATRKIRLYAANANQKGTYQVTLKGAMTDYPSNQKTSSFKVVVETDRCINTVLYAPNPLPINMKTSVKVQSSGSPLIETQQVGIFKDQYSNTDGDGTGFDKCGLRIYSLTSAKATASADLSASELKIDPNTGVISVYTENKNTIGTHSVTIVCKLKDYITKTVTLTPITVEIMPCKVTDLAMSDLHADYDQDYDLLQTTLFWTVPRMGDDISTIFTQTPACEYNYILSSTSSNSPIVTSPGSSLSFTLYSKNKSDVGVKIIDVFGTLDAYTYNPVPSISGSLKVTITDTCLKTKVDILPSVVENFVTFAGYSVTSKFNYTFNDSISHVGTLITDEQDYCGGKILTFYINETETDILVANNKEQITFSPPKQIKELGTGEAKVIARMNETDYSGIQSIALSFKVTILDYVVPSISDQLYILGPNRLFVTYDSFEILPLNDDAGSSQIEAFIFKGNSPPPILDLQCGCLEPIIDLEWINHDQGLRSFTIQTNKTSFIGVYTIVVVQLLEKFPSVVPFTSFKLSVQAEPVLVIPAIRKAPYFEEPLVPQNVTQCAGSKSQLWTFPLPEYTDPNKKQIFVKVTFDEQFFSYDQVTQTFQQLRAVLKPVNQTIYVTLSNDLKLKATYSIVVQFLCNITSDFVFNPALGQKFASLGKQKSWPTAQISTVDPTGLIRVKFNKLMKIPERPDLINNDTITLNETDWPIVKLEVKPGKYSELQQLKFNWSLRNFTTTELLIQLDFENLNYVSQNKNEPDSVKLTFYGFQYFADTQGNYMMPLTVTNYKYLPQLVSQAAMATAQSYASSGQTSMQSAFLVNTVSSLLVSGSVQQLVSSMSQLQIIVHILLVNVAYPATASVIFGKMMTLLTFQIYDFTDFYNKVFSWDPDNDGNQPLNDQFNLMGYESRYIVQNFGTLCWTILIAPVAYFLTYLLHLFCKDEITGKYKTKFHNWMFFDYWIAFFNETLLFLSVCTALNFGYFRWDAYGDAINSFLSIFFACAIVFFIVFVAVFYQANKNYRLIKRLDENFRARFGNIINDLNFKRKEKWVLVHLFLTLIRKLSLAYVLVYQQKKPVFSIVFITLQAIGMIVSSGLIEPMTEPTKNRLDLLNEAFVLIFTYHLYPLTDFMPDVETRGYVGYSLVALAFLNIGINLGFIFLKNILAALRKLKLTYLAYQQEKMKKKAFEEKLARVLLFEARDKLRRKKEQQERRKKRRVDNERLQQQARNVQDRSTLDEQQLITAEDVARFNSQQQQSRPSVNEVFGHQRQSNASRLQNSVHQNNDLTEMQIEIEDQNDRSLPLNRNQSFGTHQDFDAVRKRQNANFRTDTLIQVKTRSDQRMNTLNRPLQIQPDYESYKLKLEPDPNDPLEEIVRTWYPNVETVSFRQSTSWLHGSKIESLEVYFKGRLIRFCTTLDDVQYSTCIVDEGSNHLQIEHLREDTLNEHLQLVNNYPPQLQEEINSGQIDEELQQYEQARQHYLDEGWTPGYRNFQNLGPYNPQMKLDKKVKLYRLVKQLRKN